MSAGDGWQLIETAPRDGRDVLLYFPLVGLSADHWPRIIIAGWRERFAANQPGAWVWQARAVRSYSADFQPTHWQPLPAPPSEADK